MQCNAEVRTDFYAPDLLLSNRISRAGFIVQCLIYKKKNLCPLFPIYGYCGACLIWYMKVLGNGMTLARHGAL